MPRAAALAAALLLAVAAPPGAGANSAGSSGDCGVRTEGPWTQVPTPGPPAVYAVDPYVPSRLFASDGRVVWRSADGGCRWTTVFDVASAATLDLPPSEVTRVVAVTVPPSPTRNAVYLLLYAHRDATRTSDRPVVVRSHNGGQDWESAGRGLPDGVPPPAEERCTDQQGCGLVTGAGDPSALYLFHRAVGPSPAEIDVGRLDGSWERRSAPAGGDLTAGRNILNLRADPLAADELWALLDDGSLHHSTDGARSWTALSRPDGTRPALLDLFHAPGRPATLLLLDGAGRQPRRIVSTDGGRSFTVSAAGGLGEMPATIVHGPAAPAVLVGGPRAVAAYDETGTRFVDIDPERRAGPVDSASVSRTTVPVYAFRGQGRLVAFRPDAARPDAARPDDAAGPAGSPRTPGGSAAVRGPSGVAAPVLRPPTAALDLAAGASATLANQLSLAGRRLPLDLFFLQDTSASMRAYVAGFDRGTQQLVDDLAAAGIDVAAGVAEFYGLDLRYRRLRDIGPIDDDFRRTVASVRTHERTGPYNADDQPNLTALYQMATGAGVENPREGEPVARGQQAGFRADAVRVVVHAADEDFAFDPSGPDQGTTVAALRAAGVLHAGIHITRVGEYPRLGARLEDLSRATGATAPAGGLDCDGDGRPEIAAGAPLVCSINDDRSSVQSLDLATPLRAMLASLVAEGTATVTATASDVDGAPLGIVVSERYPGLDLGREQHLPFHVTVTCPVRPVAGEYRVELVARVQEAAVARSTAVVRCAAAPVPVAAAALGVPAGAAPTTPPPPAAPTPALPPAPTSVLPVPPALSSAPAPATIAQVAPASHPAAQLVAALAPQEAPALAEQRSEDFGFTRLAGAVAMTFAAGLALRSRTVPARAAPTRRRPT
jgi:hypothetical protein